MSERVRFVADVARGELTMDGLCDWHDPSRKTGYKLRRYREQGPAGLEDRSRRPHQSPNATAPLVVALPKELRRLRPTWGAEKCPKVLGRWQPRLELPARSTGCERLRRAGLVRQRRGRRRREHAGAPLSVGSASRRCARTSTRSGGSTQ